MSEAEAIAVLERIIRNGPLYSTEAAYRESLAQIEAVKALAEIRGWNVTLLKAHERS